MVIPTPKAATHRPLLAFSCLLLALAATPCVLQAQTYQTWRSEATSGSWQGSTNWWKGSAGPIEFGQQEWDNNHYTSQTNDNGGTAFSTWRWLYKSGASSPHTFSGDAVRFFDYATQDPSIINQSAATHFINMGIQGDGDAADPLKIQIDNNSGGGLTFNGSVDNQGSDIHVIGTASSAATVRFNGAMGGSGGLYKENSNITLLFDAANTYTGQLTIQAGTARLNGAGDTFGASTQDIRLHSGGVLDLNGVSTTVGSVAEYGNANSGNITLGAGTLTIGGANKGTFYQSSISGSGGLTMNGSGNTTMSLFGTQSYTGTTTVSSGSLTTGSALSSSAIVVSGGGFSTQGANQIADAATLTVNGGTFTLGGADTMGAISGSGGTVNIGANTLTTSSSSSTSYSGNITGTTGGFTKSGTGNQTLSGAANSWNGTTTVNGGTLTVSGSLATTGVINVDSSSVLNITGNLTQTISGGPRTLNLGRYSNQTGTINVSGSGILNAGSGMMMAEETAAGSQAFINQTGGTINTNGNVWMAGQNSTITVGGGTFSTGGSTLLMGVGTTVSSNSTLSVSGAGTVSLGTLNIGAYSRNFSAITVNLGNGTVGGNLSISGMAYGGGASAGPATFNFNGGTLHLRGSTSMVTTNTTTVVKSGGAIIDVDASRTFTITNNLTTDGSGGGLTKNGTGILTLSGNNAYTGSTAINGGTLEVAGSGLLGGGSYSGNISNSATFLYNGTNSQTLSGNISGSGTVTKNNTATLTLSGANAYSGATSINAGALRASNSTALGTTAAGTTVASGAALELSGGISIGAEALALSGTGISNGGGLRNITGDNSYAGAITLGAATRINSDSGTLTLSGGITGAQNLTFGGSGNTTVSTAAISTGAGTLTKDGAGMLTISSTGNTWNGTTTVSAGTLALSGTLATNGAVYVDGAANPVLNITGNLTSSYAAGGARSLQIAASAGNTGTINVGGSGILNLTGGGMMLGDNSGGNATFNQSGGTVTLAGSTTWMAGPNSTMNISGGNFSTGPQGFYIAGGTGTNTVSTLTVNGTGIARLGSLQVGQATTGAGAVGTINIGDGTVGGGELVLGGLTYNSANVAQTINFNGGTFTANANSMAINSSSTTVVKSGGAIINVNPGFTFTTSSNLTNGGGGGGLTKNGTGTLVLTGANTYNGTTTINAGTLTIGNGTSGSIGNTSSIVNNANLVFDNSSGYTINSITGTGNLTANATTNGFITLGGNITQNGSVSISTFTTLANSAGLRLTNDTTIAASSISITGQLGSNGAGSSTKVLTLDTSSTNGSILLDFYNGSSGRTALGAGSIVANAGTGNVTVGAQAGRFAESGAWQTASLTGGIQITAAFAQGALSVNTLTLNATAASTISSNLTFSANTTNNWTVSPGVTMSVSGRLAGNNASITKAGTGTLTLSNAANTYNGTTTINAGTLNVTGSTASSATTVANGGTLTGTGTVGAVALNTGGLVGAGIDTATAGKLNGSTLTIGAGTGYLFTIAGTGTTAGTDFDQIALSGALTLNNTSASKMTLYLYGTPTGWSGTGTYTWDFITAASQTGFSAGNFTTDFTNFGIASGLRGGNWTFSNPTAGNIRLTYTGAGGGSSVWSGGTGNWDAGFSPAVGEGYDITYNGTAGGTSTNNISSSTLGAVGNITFTTGAGAYTLAANSGSAGFNGSTALSVTGNIVNNSSNTQTVNTALGSGSTRTVDAASGNIAIGGAISGVGGLTKNGTNTLTLSGSNTYSGATTVNAGTLSLTGNLSGTAITVAGTSVFTQGAAGIISGTSSFTHNSTGTSTLAGTNTYTGATTVNAGTLQIGGAGQLGSGAYSGNIAINGASSTFLYASTANQTLSGLISGSGVLTKNGSSTLTLTNNNSYTGATTINTGTLVLQGNSNSTSYTIASGAVLELNVATGVNRDMPTATFSGTGTLVKSGANTLSWGAGSGTFAMGAGSLIDIQGGTIAGGSGNENWTNNYADMNIASGGALWGAEMMVQVNGLTGNGSITTGYGGYNAGITMGAGNGSATFNGTIATTSGQPGGTITKSGTGLQTLNGNNTYNGTTTISGGTLQIGASGRLGGGTYSSLINNNANFIYSGTAAQTLSGVISGTGNLTQNASSTLVLSAANSYSGATTINAGTLEIGGSGQLGTGAYAGSIANNGTFLSNSTSSQTLSGVISGTGALTKANTGTLTLSNNNTYTGTTTINAGTLEIGGSGQLGTGAYAGSITNNSTFLSNSTSSQTLSGVISGTGALTKANTGTLTLSNNNTYTGTTTINAGTISIGHANALGTTGNITFGGGRLQYGVGITQDLSSRIKNSGSAILIDTNTNNVTFSTNLGASNNTGGLTKNGSGTLVLGTDNTYSGTTTVNGGTLQLSGNISSSGLTLASGGIVSIGTASAVAKYNASTITLQGGAGYAFTIGNVNTSVAGTDYDQLTATGALTFNNTAANPFTVYLNGTPTGWSNTGSYTWNIMSGASISGFNSGNFAVNTSNFGIAGSNRTGTWSFATSGGNLTLSYALATPDYFWSGGSGNWTDGFTPSAPTPDDNLYFTGTGGTVTNNMANSTISSVNFITFNSTAGAYTLAADATVPAAGTNSTIPLTVKGDIVNNSASTQTISMALALGGSSTGVINTAAGNITVSGVISGGAGLTKTGNGTLTLSGTNTYSGVTTVDNGTLVLSAIPTAGSIVINSGATVNAGLNTLTNITAITINGGTLTPGHFLRAFNGALTMTDGIISAGGDFAAASYTLYGNNTIATSITDRGATFNVVSGTTNITGAIQLYWGGNIVKNGAGTLTLSGANNYPRDTGSSSTTLNAGTLNINSATALGASATPFTINGGTIDNTSAGAITLTNNNAQNWNGDFTFTGTRDLNMGTGNVTMGGSRVITVNAGNLTIGGVISGAGFGLTKNGNGTLSIASTNTIGAKTVNAGTLRIVVNGNVAPMGVSNGTVNLNNGSTLQVGYSGGNNPSFASQTVNIDSNGGATIANDGLNGLIQGGTAGWFAINTNGGAQSQLTSLNGGYYNNQNGGGGILFNVASGSNATADVLVPIGGTWGITKNGTGKVLITSSPNVNGLFAINGGTVEFGGSAAPTLTNTAFNITNNGTFSWNSTANVAISQNITGTGNLTKGNTGTLTLNGSNTYSGLTTVNAGTLAIGNNMTIGAIAGAGNITIGAGFTLGTNSSTNSTFSGVIGSSGALTKNGTGTLTLTGNNTYSGATNINAGTIEIGSTGRLGGGSYAGDITNNGSLIYSGTSNQTLSGVIGGTGALAHNATSTLTLSNNNTYSGATTINAGTLQITSTGLLGGGSYSGNIANSGTLLFASNGNQTLSGILSGGGALAKNGTGTLTLTGNNSYSGATSINSGTLVVNGSAANSAVTIGNTGVLGGNGTVGALTVQSGGRVAPGNSPGNLNASTLTLEGGGGYNWEIANVSGTAGTDWDLITVGGGTGAATVSATSGNKFTVYIIGNPAGWNTNTSYDWNIIDWGTVTGFDANAFAVDTTGFTGTAPVGTWSFSNTGGFLNLAYSAGEPTWSGGAGNWSTGFSPALTTGNKSLTFDGAAGGTATNDIASATVGSVAGITFNSTAGAYTLAANSGSAGYDTASAMQLNGNILNNSTATQTINLALASTATRVYDAAAGNLTIGGAISGTGGLTKNGSHLLALSANNTYSGDTTINAGTLQITSTGLLGGGSYSGNIANSGTLLFASNGNQTLSGILSGSGALAKNGTGTLALTGNNTHTGGTTLNAGTLSIGHAKGLGTGNFVQTSGGSLLVIDTTGTISNNMSVYNVRASQSATLGGAITVNNAVWDVDGGDTLTISGGVGGSGGVTKNGTGTLILSGSNTYSGATVVNSGTLNAAASGALGATPSVTVNNGGSLLVSANGSIGDATPVTLAGGTLALGGNTGEVVGALTLTSNSVVDMGSGAAWISFDSLTSMLTSTTQLQIWNYTPGSDAVYFRNSANIDGSLAYISFYSGAGTGTFFNALNTASFSPPELYPTPVPEPETYATALLLLLGAGWWTVRRHRARKAAPGSASAG